jgi:hypothetical protein
MSYGSIQVNRCFLYGGGREDFDDLFFNCMFFQSRKITLPPHVSYYCRIYDNIKEDYTANSRELLLHDQLMQRQNSTTLLLHDQLMQRQDS